MKKNLLVLFTLLCCFAGFSQGVVVRNTTYTNSNANALVNTLLGSDRSCLVRPANVSVTTGAQNYSYPAGTGVGIFDNSNAAFPMPTGVVLVSGTAATASGPNNQPTSTDGNAAAEAWIGDADLEAAFSATYGAGFKTMNASVLEFDFTAISTSISIPYIFASEEYGQYQCSSKDAMAILIRTASGGAYTNIATLPGGAPVSVTTLRDNSYNSACASANAASFGVFNGGGAATTATTNFEGQSVQLTATATGLTVGTVYHIKIVVADDGNANPLLQNGKDTRYNSAVFLPAGVNLGQNALPANMLAATNTALCQGTPYTLRSLLTDPSFTYSWANATAPGTPIDSGTSTQISNSGTYILTITNAATSCSSSQQIQLDFATPPVAGTPSNIYSCPGVGGSFTYNLNVNNSALLNGNTQANVTYHATLLAAQDGTGALNPTYSTSSTSTTTIYARIKSTSSSCYTTASFDLIPVATPIASTPPSIVGCETAAGNGRSVFNLTQNTATILGTQNTSQYAVSYFTSQAGADNGTTDAITSPNSYTYDSVAGGSATQTIYARVQSTFNTSCYVTTSFTIRVSTLPTVSTLPNIDVCGFYDLPAITDGQYYTAAGGPTGTGTRLNLPHQITSTQTVYIYNANADGCFSQSQFRVNVLQAITVPADVSRCDSYVLPVLPNGHQYTTAANCGGTVLPAGTVITQTTRIYYCITTAVSCSTEQASFMVNINKADVLTDQTLCSGGTYTLPALTAGNSYYTAAGGPSGGGNLVLAGTVINSSRTIYIYKPDTAANCFSQSNFRVNIAPALGGPQGPINNCGTYYLPTLTRGAYYYGPGGTIPIVGNAVPNSATIYVYNNDTATGCVQERSFVVNVAQRPTIVNNYPNVTACDNYTLPIDNTIEGYYTAPNKSGTFYASNVTHLLTQTTTLYATTASASGTTDCYAQRQFTITIVRTNLILDDITRCTEYFLPALENGTYYTNPGHVVIPAGTRIATTQDIDVEQVNRQGTTVLCTGTGTFTVKILPAPVVSNPTDVVVCNSYTLPALPAGQQYRDAAAGQGNVIAAGTPITASQTIYVYAVNTNTPPDPSCASENSFEVTIIDSSVIPTDVANCGSYTLPALPAGQQYRDAPAGGGNVIAAGTVITSTSPLEGVSIYFYAPVTSGTNCTDNASFKVNITDQPTVTNYPDVNACNVYILPALPAGQAYYTAANGGGVTIAAGSPVTSNTTVYPYAGVPGCEAYDEINITITPLLLTAMSDQTVCENEGYVLPPTESVAGAIVGYYKYSGGPDRPGGNPVLLPTNVINTSQTVYEYAYLTNSTSCNTEIFFNVTAVPSPVIDITTVDPDGDGVIAVCGTYTLPAYPTVTPTTATTTVGYYSQPNGGGAQFTPGQVLSTSMPVYVYVHSGGAPDCTAEAMLDIYVNPEAPVVPAACDVVTLPSLPIGQQYWTDPSGTGTQLFAGHTFTANQRIYFYIPAAAACTSNTFIDITVNHTPVLNLPASPQVHCDGYQLPVLAAGNYFSGPDRTGTAYNAGDIISTTMTMYVYAESGSSPNCVAQGNFNINITATPNTVAYSDIDYCDAYTLPTLPAGYHYYSQQGGPLAAGQSETAGGTVLTTNATPMGTRFYIYSEATANPACFTETTFNVMIYSASIDAEVVQLADAANALSNTWAQTYTTSGNADPTLNNLLSVNIETCDSYTLPNLNLGGTNPSDTYIQHFYVLPGGPNAAGQQVVTNLVMDVNHPQYNAATGTITVYLYRILNGRLDCSDESIITTQVNTTPVLATVPTNVTACDTTTLPALGSGFAYYSQPGGNGLITNLTLTATQDVYAYAQVGTNQICSTEYPFRVTINTIDIPRPADVIACEQYVLTTPVPATARYFQYPGGPNVAGQVEYAVSPTPHIFTTGTYNVYLWDHTSTTPDCTDEEQFTIRVISRPTAITPSNVEACAINDAGTRAIFDLTNALAQAVGGQADVRARLFETQADADFGVNERTDFAAYTNINSPTQQMIIRTESTLTGGCYVTVPVTLIVNPRPIAVDPLPDYEICDNGSSDTDGIGTFDLNTYIPRVLGTLNPATHTVTFYETLTALENGGTPIATPATFDTVTTTVYIKVAINTTGCYDVVPLELIVNPKPVVTNPTPLSLCDVDTPGNEKEIFDLTSKINEITGGVLGLNVTFHTLLTDAEGGVAAIPNPTAYENVTPGVQPIFVRITNAATLCYRVVLLDIRVEPLPVLTPLTALERTVCSTNDDGYGVFDLDQMAIEMIDGAPGVSVIFYPTLLNAERDINRITNTAAYQNINPNIDFIYAVPVNAVNGCKGTPIAIQLFVNPAPSDVMLQPLTVCDDTDLDGQDDTYIFNLTDQDPIIRGQILTPGTYTISYYTSELDANNGVPRIVNDTAYPGHDENVIWVRIENAITECFIITSFELIINQPQELAHPANLIVCDDTTANDGFAQFDLTLREDAILTPTGIGESNVVRYYTSETDRDAGTNTFIVDPTQFTNTVNPQNIFIRVITPQGCVSKESMLIMVTPLPVPATPQPLVECDVVSSTDPEGYHEFNLTDAATEVRGGDSLSQIHYYANQADYDNGVEIADPTRYVNTVQWNDTVIVSLTRTNTMPGAPTCETPVTLNLQVNPLPPVYDPATGTIKFYAICNPMSTGFEQFNLIQHINDQLTANGVNPTDYYIRFYKDAAAEAAGTALPHIYTNVNPNVDSVWVVVRNVATTCTIKGTMMLYAEQAAVANPIVVNNPLRTCDDDAHTSGDNVDNDGATIIDLTRVASEVLGSQSATQFSLDYYTTQAGALAGGTTTNPDWIADPVNYPGVTSGTIWVRIVNTVTNAPCFDVTSFNYVIDLLPEPVVTSGTGDTVCKDFRSGATDGVELWSGITGTGYTYQWYVGGTAIAGATGEYYTAIDAGMYTVEVTSPEGCVSIPSEAFEIFLSGPATPVSGSGYVISNAFSADQTLTVLVEGYGEYQYSIAPGNEEATGPWQNSNVFENMPIGYYTIYVRDVKTDYPCAIFPIADVSVVDFPKFFTPNGDGYNDYWNIVGMANDQYADARIMIFDRFGKLIKQLSPDSRVDQQEGWDGTFNGKPSPSDDYWFTVEFTENGVAREFRGHFALKR